MKVFREDWEEFSWSQNFHDIIFLYDKLMKFLSYILYWLVAYIKIAVCILVGLLFYTSVLMKVN
jgi:hypothetical protein